MNDVTTDAKDRARRTLLMGLALDLAVAVALVVNDWVGAADITDATAWQALAVLVAKSVIHSVASYVLRLKVAPAAR